MNILHATTDPDLLTRLREMLGSSARADIAVGYFFMSGFEAISDSLSRMEKVRILVGRTDRPTLEAVASGLQQSQALKERLEADQLVPKRQREAIAQESLDRIAEGLRYCPRPVTRKERSPPFGTWWRLGRWKYEPTFVARFTPRRTCAGTTTTLSRARRLSAPPI